MKTVRTFTLTFSLALMFVVSLLTTSGAAHAATRQVSSSSSTSSSSCGIVPLTFPFYSSSTPYGLELTRSSDGSAILLAATTTPDELRLGMGVLYVWIRVPGQTTWTFYENLTLNSKSPDSVSDFVVTITIVPNNQYTPEAVFNSCEWMAQLVKG